MTDKLHATLGASTAKRWVNCPGSVTLSKEAPPERESASAMEGTKAHELMEALLNSLNLFKRPLSTATMISYKKNYGEEMFNHVYPMYERILKRFKDVDKVLVEEKISLDIVAPDMFGTVDCALIEEFGTLEIIDLKYGAGIVVEAEENMQLIYYALGLAAKYNFAFENVRMTIYQPRAFHNDGAWRSYDLSIDELKKWIVYFQRAVKRTIKNSDRFFPGEWCRFCPASVICKEATTKALAQAKIDFEPSSKKELSLPNPKDLSPSQMAVILRKVDGLEAWISNVRAYAFDLMNRGGEIEGFKLVAKQGRKHWGDIEQVTKEAKKKFGDKAFEPVKLLSPAQMRDNVAGEEWVNARTVTVSSGLTIAKEDDKRPKVSSITEDFKDEVTTKLKEISHDGKKESGKKSGTRDDSTTSPVKRKRANYGF